jgi:phosphoribosylanthranilate isomerase
MTAGFSPTSRPRLKVCCIASIDEANLAIEHGANAVGLVSSMPSGPGVIPDSRIAEIAATIPPGVSTFLLTSSTEVEPIVRLQRKTSVNTIQLCDEMPIEDISELRKRLPGVSLVQVIHVMDDTAVGAALQASEAAHALLLDSGNPTKVVKELGGTGRTHDWRLSRRIRDAVNLPVFLAGGLTPENVGDAINDVRPFGVDVCSGLRTDDQLDPEKLQRFVHAIEASIP